MEIKIITKQIYDTDSIEFCAEVVGVYRRMLGLRKFRILA
jgi:hypothetical protein